MPESEKETCCKKVLRPCGIILRIDHDHYQEKICDKCGGKGRVPPKKKRWWHSPTTTQECGKCEGIGLLLRPILQTN